MSEQTKDRVRAQFGATAEGYISSAIHAGGDDLRRMVELAELQGDERVLDIATGGGHTALAFAARARQVVASDLTPRMLELAAAHFAAAGVANISTQLADAEELPFEERSFDVVSCRIAPHHFPEPARFVHEAARVLRGTPERPGRFVLIDLVGHEQVELDRFVNQVERLRDPSHVRSYRVSEWVAWCAAAGLQVVQLERFKRSHAIEGWMERARLPREQRPALLAAFSSAPALARRYHQVQFDGQQPSAWQSDSMLLLAHKLA